ncbi:MAG: zinc metallopeptidase [Lachnospiraceae bacterium]|nr:zinc metallopeptidase [Lachnospiraceae bacterium]MBQ3037237.1 zinc metallopeptidase [Lachnospiraceae bacterium]
MFFFYDPTWWLIIVGMLLCLAASGNVSATYRKYSKIENARGMTASEVAERILKGAGISDVRIERIEGELTDHYDPKNKVVRLSEGVYYSTSVAAIGVAAHECGHVLQHYNGYLPIRVRNAIVPVVNFGSNLSWPLILLGVLFGLTRLVDVGIILFTLVLLFQIVTLPVEFNASKRAIGVIRDTGILYGDEITGAKKVLNAAALTYVAGVIATALQVLRLFLLFGRRRRN